MDERCYPFFFHLIFSSFFFIVRLSGRFRIHATLAFVLFISIDKTRANATEWPTKISRPKIEKNMSNDGNSKHKHHKHTSKREKKRRVQNEARNWQHSVVETKAPIYFSLRFFFVFDLEHQCRHIF